jgi:hypothetical protein
LLASYCVAGRGRAEETIEGCLGLFVDLGCRWRVLNSGRLVGVVAAGLLTLAALAEQALEEAHCSRLGWVVCRLEEKEEERRDVRGKGREEASGRGRGRDRSVTAAGRIEGALSFKQEGGSFPTETDAPTPPSNVTRT